MPAPSRRHHHTTAHLGKLTLKEGRHLLEVMWWIRAPRGPDPKPRQSHHVTMPPGSYRRDSEDTDGTRGDPRLGSLNGHNAKTLEAPLSSPTGSRRSQPSGGDGKVRAQDPKPHKSWLQEPDPDGRVRQRMPRSLASYSALDGWGYRGRKEHMGETTHDSQITSSRAKAPGEK